MLHCHGLRGLFNNFASFLGSDGLSGQFSIRFPQKGRVDKYGIAEKG
jgi:hypothetical protein